jgi:uncharacterized protein (TIGR03083 family)
MQLDAHVLTNEIAEHSRRLAEAAEGHLDAPIEHCPGWTMEDLLRHLIETHWFWATIARDGLTQPPDSRPAPSEGREFLIDDFLNGAQNLVEVLRDADQSRAVWTWAPGQRDVAFITRHQVQEIVVHHWDVAHATGASFEVDPLVASDSVEEFLSFSVSTDVDPAEPVRPGLHGPFALVCSDIERGWTLRDGAMAGTVRFSASVTADTPQLRATSTELLLWLYSRIELRGDEQAMVLGERLRALSFTD